MATGVALPRSGLWGCRVEAPSTRNAGMPVRPRSLVVEAQKFKGKVVGRFHDKTAAVEVCRTVYDKQTFLEYRKFRKFQVHDPYNASKVGDLVTFVTCRPISATKKFLLTGILGNKYDPKGVELPPLEALVKDPLQAASVQEIVKRESPKKRNAPKQKKGKKNKK